MPVFAYSAINTDGRVSSGTLTCETRAAALAQIGKQGLRPVKLEEARSIEAAAKKVRAATPGQAKHTGKVSHKAVEAFTRELANLLSGGVPLSRALSLLKREAHSPAAKQLIGDVHDDVVGGSPLGDAMAKWPKSFSTVYVAMVRAGEAGGFLDVVLNQIADFRLRESDLKGKVKAAMVYPAILAILAVLVLIFLLAFFIPQFQGIFENFGASLPLITQCIIGASGVVQHYGPIVAVVVVMLVIFLKRALTTQTGRRRMEIVMLSTPVLGKVTAHFALVRFARMLGTLIGAGVPLIASLRVAREAIGNQTLADAVLHATEQVQRGSSLSKALSNSPKLFPPSVVEMVAIAEETGRLDKELIRLAGTYETDLDRQLRLLVSIAEPVMLFVMASIIGTVVVGMLLPVFELQQLIH